MSDQQEIKFDLLNKIERFIDNYMIGNYATDQEWSTLNLQLVIKSKELSHQQLQSLVILTADYLVNNYGRSMDLTQGNKYHPIAVAVATEGSNLDELEDGIYYGVCHSNFVYFVEEFIKVVGDVYVLGKVKPYKDSQWKHDLTKEVQEVKLAKVSEQTLFNRSEAIQLVEILCEGLLRLGLTRTYTVPEYLEQNLTQPIEKMVLNLASGRTEGLAKLAKELATNNTDSGLHFCNACSTILNTLAECRK